MAEYTVNVKAKVDVSELNKDIKKKGTEMSLFFFVFFHFILPFIKIHSTYLSFNMHVECISCTVIYLYLVIVISFTFTNFSFLISTRVLTALAPS